MLLFSISVLYGSIIYMSSTPGHVEMGYKRYIRDLNEQNQDLQTYNRSKQIYNRSKFAPQDCRLSVDYHLLNDNNNNNNKRKHE